MESLRATGYSLPDAVSDLIDNSIAAGAHNIWLNFHWSGADSWASILDDGSGMSEAELIDAMRIGSRSPREAREPSDLGRYGLGLKTASISQSRSLTVVTQTAKGNAIHTRRWDLDHLASTGDWQLLNVPVESTAGRDVERLSQLGHGTLVVWNKLDRLVGDAGVDNVRARRQFHDTLRGVEAHVAMVFHRFMAERNSVSIWLNDRQIKAWDPFLADEKATQRLSSETLGPPEAGVSVNPFVLPHHSRLSGEKHRSAGGPAGWNAQQGFYVYRNRRLLLPGDWLGLGFMKEEHYKLARIQLDLSNSSDHEWEIDVRKSKARPPLPYRDDLRRIAKAVRKRAVTVYVPSRPETGKGTWPGRQKSRARRSRWKGQYHQAKGFRFYLVDDERIEQLISWHQMGDEQAFGAALRQVKEAGLIPEDQVRLCAIGDGAPWIWKWVEELFPSARQMQQLPARGGRGPIRGRCGACCPLAGSESGAPVLRRGHRRGLGSAAHAAGLRRGRRGHLHGLDLPAKATAPSRFRQPSQGGIPDRLGCDRIRASLHRPCSSETIRRLVV
ncbi:MAG: ATP-binding protein [Gemmatimonadetes bacterium]|nr:ATP-binding protein [Gemmatimonadota bacterium]